MMSIVRFLLLVSALGMLMPALAPADAIPVELRQTEQGWLLLRAGEPYFIQGAGGKDSLQQLAATGANSIRTWGADDIDELLDEAHALGLSVTVGIWLGHERHGFDYDDDKQVREQFERARQTVLRYRDHPAVLLWGVGNEMEGFESGDDPAIWSAVNDIAAMIKEIDPNHPTMTVTAEIGGGRIESINQFAPDIDIHGINAYGGAASLPQRYVDGGGSKPYLITEFGPTGAWESPTTEWGAPLELTSTEKAAFYRRTYELAVTGAPGLALGSYVFLWGHKMEATATWFGMFLEDGARLAAVDTMMELWSGERPADLAPVVEPLVLEGDARLDPGDELRVRAVIADPEEGPVTARWALRPDSDEFATGGDFRPNMRDIESAILDGDTEGARVRMPADPGPYRLFLYAYDEAGNAATANVPLLVKGEVGKIRLPLSVYEDGFEGMRWVPSGWMGMIDSLSLDGQHAENPHEGKACIKMRYEGEFGWAGVAWQHPANNWGDQDGGFDLRDAGKLEFWARGEYGGEQIKAGVGLLENDVQYPDSGKTSVDGIVLTRDWKRYRVPVKKIDRSSIKTGFVVSVTGRSTPVTLYLDSIRFVR
ncbi:MAG: glycoside hydrolase family 2 TIM barrel-domain containing protein [Gammaproteobacteria bacterium]|nr:glycoside hydrolase family 2 TIM barrel-domain containing protein [Gammaproteobacteria bacterium]